MWLSTPWPELYADLDVRFVRTGTSLRTQAQNEARQPPDRWSRPPDGCERVRVAYGHAELAARGGIVRAMERQVPLGDTPFRFDLPPLPASPVASARPIAVVRPVTVRTEWRNEARNPDPAHVAWLARELRKSHTVVAVAHLARGQEWALDIPPHDIGFLNGELDVMQLLALVAAADVVVGGVGWIVPAAIAAKVNAFIVLGGQLGHNGPDVITDPRMDLERIGWAKPRGWCRCTNMRHRCPKLIPDLPEQWRAWAQTRWPAGLVGAA